MCAICYEKEDIVLAYEIRGGRDIGGKKPLLICRYCIDMKFEIPCSGGRTNQRQKNVQAQQTKRKHFAENVQSGRRKARNTIIISHAGRKNNA